MFRIELTGETIEDLKAKVKDLTMLFYPLPSTLNQSSNPISELTAVPTPTLEVEAPCIDRDEVKKRIAEIVKVKGNTKLKSILDEFGAAKVKDVPDEKLAELLQRMEAA